MKTDNIASAYNNIKSVLEEIGKLLSNFKDLSTIYLCEFCNCSPLNPLFPKINVKKDYLEIKCKFHNKNFVEKGDKVKFVLGLNKRLKRLESICSGCRSKNNNNLSELYVKKSNKAVYCESCLNNYSYEDKKNKFLQIKDIYKYCSKHENDYESICFDHLKQLCSECDKSHGNCNKKFKYKDLLNNNIEGLNDLAKEYLEAISDYIFKLIIIKSFIEFPNNYNNYHNITALLKEGKKKNANESSSEHRNNNNNSSVISTRCDDKMSKNNSQSFIDDTISKNNSQSSTDDTMSKNNSQSSIPTRCDTMYKDNSMIKGGCDSTDSINSSITHNWIDQKKEGQNDKREEQNINDGFADVRVNNSDNHIFYEKIASDSLNESNEKNTDNSSTIENQNKITSTENVNKSQEQNNTLNEIKISLLYDKNKESEKYEIYNIEVKDKQLQKYYKEQLIGKIVLGSETKKYVNNLITVKNEQDSKNIKLQLKLHVKSFCQFFKGCKDLLEVDLTNCKLENLNDTTGMFHGTINLQKVNLSGFKGEALKTIKYTFYKCTNLISIKMQDLTSKHVEKMNSFISCCQNLKHIDISHFEPTKRLDNLEGVFNCCTSLCWISMNLKNVSENCNVSRTLEDTNKTGVFLYRKGKNNRRILEKVGKRWKKIIID